MHNIFKSASCGSWLNCHVRFIVTKPSPRSKWREDQQAMAHLGLRSNTWASLLREWIYDMRQGQSHFMAFLKAVLYSLTPPTCNTCIYGGYLHISSPLGCRKKLYRSLWSFVPRYAENSPEQIQLVTCSSRCFLSWPSVPSLSALRWLTTRQPSPNSSEIFWN